MSLETESVVYNGNVMTKRELLQYFIEVIKTYSEYTTAYERRKERASKIKALELDSKRRTFSMRQMLPPTGLSALSGKRRREYQRWLDEASQREAELRKKEEAEDERVRGVENRVQVLIGEQQEDNRYIKELADNIDRLHNAGIVPDEYAQPVPIKLIASYLAADRANTLTEAINLYHQEMHWNRMEQMARQQIINNEVANRRMAIQQQEYMSEMAAIQRQHMSELRQSMSNTEQAANDAKFYSELNFWINMMGD